MEEHSQSFYYTTLSYNFFLSPDDGSDLFLITNYSLLITYHLLLITYYYYYY